MTSHLAGGDRAGRHRELEPLLRGRWPPRHRIARDRRSKKAAPHRGSRSTRRLPLHRRRLRFQAVRWRVGSAPREPTSVGSRTRPPKRMRCLHPLGESPPRPSPILRSGRPFAMGTRGEAVLRPSRRPCSPSRQCDFRYRRQAGLRRRSESSLLLAVTVVAQWLQPWVGRLFGQGGVFG